MPDVRVRGLAESTVHLLKSQAKQRGLSLQATLKELLTEIAMEPRRRVFEELKEHQCRMREKYGVMPDSTPGIREERDRIG